MRYFMLFCLLFSVNVQASKLYQWVDEEGVTHYTQTPPPSYVGAEERTIHTPKPVAEPTQAEQATDSLEALKQTRAQNCKKAQDNLSILTSDQEVYLIEEQEITAEGEATPPQQKAMSIEDRQQKITETQHFISEFCQTAEPEQNEQADAEQ